MPLGDTFHIAKCSNRWKNKPAGHF